MKVINNNIFFIWLTNSLADLSVGLPAAFPWENGGFIMKELLETIVAELVEDKEAVIVTVDEPNEKVHHDARAHGDATTTDAGTPGTAKAGEDPRRTGGR